MVTCRKIYTDIPFAHRQHNHEGHCSLVHGHNWSIALTFSCSTLDKNGFVVDFGDLKFIREWINTNLDHAFVFNHDDPLREKMLAAAPDAYQAYLVPNCSCEGLAEHFCGVFQELLDQHHGGRVKIQAIEVFEDSRNSAIYRP